MNDQSRQEFIRYLDFHEDDEGINIVNKAFDVHQKKLSETSEVLQWFEPDRRMGNVHYSTSNSLQPMDQPAGSSQPSQDQSNQKKKARKERDARYRKKLKEEREGLERKVDELKQENEVLKNQLASSNQDADRSKEYLKQMKEDMCQLKDMHAGLAATVTEMCKKMIAQKKDDTEGTGKKQKKAFTADWTIGASEERCATKMKANSKFGKTYTIEDVMANIQALPGIKDNPIPAKSWLKATFRFIDPTHREIYMSIEDPKVKLEWLKIASE